MGMTAFLYDDRFSHSKGAVSHNTPRDWRWVREGPLGSLPVFYSHEKMFEVSLSVPKPRRFGLLIESPAIAPRLYNDVHSVFDDFALVFTSNSQLLSNYENARFIPSGGVWLPEKRADSNLSEADKVRMVSMISSNKLHCPEHIRRYAIALGLERGVREVDVFRQGFRFSRRTRRQAPILFTSSGLTRELSKKAVEPSEYLSQYRYSIILENFLDDTFLTEKILNCFASQTIPIYRGASNVGEWFDYRGVIAWRTWRDLMEILEEVVSPEDYSRRLEAIRRNFNRVQGFVTIEDYIHDHYAEEIGALLATI